MSLTEARHLPILAASLKVIITTLSLIFEMANLMIYEPAKIVQKSRKWVTETPEINDI